ncbi:DNA polymerase III subunit gamma/tau [Loktanella sp. 3ANDIMAR09]|uniref:SRPBCC family protein n=1 Tax=Loktanella sp. 3ANDIMAR09 TaxID=1225657 RepID=UPI0006FD304F|nr:SRPBCC family protein [Loktanella sp. 3ANDIMAR09]KQI67781.1 DNA polymerase III subunit gamma/tau [Loktanella sp. 3ANDIMAR09]
MKFSAREDIEAPIDVVFASVTDFDTFERQMIRRGAEVRRTDPDGIAGVGSVWDVAFSYRGRARKITATVARMEKPNLLELTLVANGLNGVSTIELLPLSQNKTRMSMAIDLSAKTLSARLLLQSLKLAKSNLTNRFKKRVADFAASIESREKPTRS